MAEQIKDEKEKRKYKGWRDLEKKISNQLVRIETKLIDSSGLSLIYEGTYFMAIGKYHILKNARLYKYNVFKDSKELIKQIPLILIKEDVISNIEPVGISLD